MFYLTKYSNVIRLQTYGKGPLSEKRNPLSQLRGLQFNSKGSFIYTPSNSRCYTNCGALVGTRIFTGSQSVKKYTPFINHL